MAEPRSEPWPRTIVASLASVQLTVLLMVLGIVLVLAGTLAQTDADLFLVQRAYFRSWFVHVPFWRVFLPGGYLLGAAMTVNILAATMRRPLRLTPRSLGILATHGAVVLFLVGELATGLLARETTMQISEGQTVHYSYSVRDVELSITDISPAEHDLVVSAPVALLHAGESIRHSLLPFEVVIGRWLPDSRVERASAEEPAVATGGFGTEWVAVAQEERPIDAPPIPSGYVSLVRDGQALGTYLVSLHIGEPQLVELDGRAYLLALRLRRFYEPFSLRLIDFTHERYAGSEMARNFASRLQLLDPAQRVDREVVISMNNPLRHRGLAFYQASYKDDDTTTVLQVVRNPSWTVPYLALSLGTLGMLLYFGEALVRGTMKVHA